MTVKYCTDIVALDNYFYMRALDLNGRRDRAIAAREDRLYLQAIAEYRAEQRKQDRQNAGDQ